MEKLFHIAARNDAETGRAGGLYASELLQTEGFVHCSYAHQLAAVLARYFKGVEGLVILEIDPAEISSRC